MITAIRFPLLLFAALFVLPSWASARDGTQLTSKDIRVIRDYAICVVKDSGRLMADAILADADNETMQNLISSKEMGVSDFSQLAHRNRRCFVENYGSGSDALFTGDMFRYIIAEALVETDVPVDYLLDPSSKPVLQHAAIYSEAQRDADLATANSEYQRTKILRDFQTKLANSYLERFGECVVRKNPVASRKLLAASINTTDENRSIEQLQPTFGYCLVGIPTITLSRLSARGIIALNYYRLAIPLTSKSKAGSN